VKLLGRKCLYHHLILEPRWRTSCQFDLSKVVVVHSIDPVRRPERFESCPLRFTDR
jgi:hypothetical protein